MEVYNIYLDKAVARVADKYSISNSHLLSEIKKATEKEAKELRLIVNSEGGEVYEGFAMYNTLMDAKREGFKVTGYIHGICASIMTLVVSACDSVEISETAQWMIHECKGGAEGTAAQLESTAKSMRQINEIMASNYAEKTGKSIEEMRAAMAFDNWMTPTEAKNFGFVDTVRMPIAAYGIFNPTNMNNEKTILDKINTLLAKVGFKPAAFTVKLADGSTTIYGDGDLEVGKTAFIDEAMSEKAAAGEHVLDSGQIIVVDEAGVITEVREVELEMNAELAAKDEEIEELKAALTNATGEVEALKATIETEKQDFTAQLTTIKAMVTNGGVRVKPTTQVEPKKTTVAGGLDQQAEHIKRQLGIKN